MLKRDTTSKPRKVRRQYRNKPLHKRQKKMMAPLTDEAKAEYEIKRAPVRRGDKVIVEKGDYKDQIGEVTQADLKNYRIFIKGVEVERPSGENINIPVKPWNVSIMELKMDEVRREILERKEKPKEIEELAVEEEEFEKEELEEREEELEEMEELEEAEDEGEAMGEPLEEEEELFKEESETEE